MPNINHCFAWTECPISTIVSFGMPNINYCFVWNAECQPVFRLECQLLFRLECPISTIVSFGMSNANHRFVWNAQHQPLFRLECEYQPLFRLKCPISTIVSFGKHAQYQPLSRLVCPMLTSFSFGMTNINHCSFTMPISTSVFVVYASRGMVRLVPGICFFPSVLVWDRGTLRSGSSSILRATYSLSGKRLNRGTPTRINKYIRLSPESYALSFQGGEGCTHCDAWP